MARSVTLTEQEYAALRRESTRTKVLHGSYGHGLVWLVGIPENRWAIQRVEEMRALDRSSHG